MEYKHSPPSLLELRKAREPRAKTTWKEAKTNFTPLENFAMVVTRKVGTMGFFFLLTFWTVGWLLWNLYAPVSLRFDPAPAFVIWIFMSNVVQLVLLPLVMVGQNLEGKYADMRAQEDYDVNKKAEHEIEIIIAHLENQNELLLEMVRKIERR